MPAEGDQRVVPSLPSAVALAPMRPRSKMTHKPGRTHVKCCSNTSQ